MKTEVSAGGIVVRKRMRIWEVLVIRDMNDVWTFPKGLVEKGEKLAEAAAREIKEEVGVSNVARLTELPPVRYMYRRNGLISKTVHYFLFQSAAKEKLRPQRKEGIRQAQWMPIDEALAIIGYAKTNTSLLLKVKQWILSSRPT